MRKALIAAIVASALFAVGAFAAEFTLNAEDVASGTDAVDDCTGNVDIDFNEVFAPTLSDWYVQDIDITLDAANTCGAAELTLVIQNEAGDDVLIETKTLTGTEGGVAGNVSIQPDCTAATAACAGTVDTTEYLMVGQVWNAALLLDGVEYTPLAP